MKITPHAYLFTWTWSVITSFQILKKWRENLVDFNLFLLFGEYELRSWRLRARKYLERTVAGWRNRIIPVSISQRFDAIRTQTIQHLFLQCQTAFNEHLRHFESLLFQALHFQLQCLRFSMLTFGQRISSFDFVQNLQLYLIHGQMLVNDFLRIDWHHARNGIGWCDLWWFGNGWFNWRGQWCWWRWKGIGQFTLKIE